VRRPCDGWAGWIREWITRYGLSIVRVLLMSPMADRDVAGGDVTYTEALLARPPEGVTYTTYVDALDEGSLVERGRRPRGGLPGPTDTVILGVRGVEHGLRRAGLLFREPYSYVTVSPGAFDLVHAHLFAVRMVGAGVPLVTSSGFPLPVLYEDRFGWSHRHVAVSTVAERVLARAVGVELPWLPPRRAARAMVQSEHYRHQLIDAGADPDRVVVHPLGSTGTAGRPRGGPPRTIGYISTGFESKGGPVVLDAFRKLLAECPTARLIIVGSEPRRLDSSFPVGSVEWHGRVPHAEVLDSVLPRVDVLALPTRCDSGPPYVVIEALQRGIPVVGPDQARRGEGRAGAGGRRGAAGPPPGRAAVHHPFDPDTYPLASRAALDLWSSRYSMAVLADRIGGTYRAARRASRRGAGTA